MNKTQLVRKIEMAALFEKASCVQSERNTDLDSASLDASHRSKKILLSNKHHATAIHVDVRGAATQQTNRLMKRIAILETHRLKLRRNESGQLMDSKELRFNINELRLSRIHLDQVFDTIKKEIEALNELVQHKFDTANTTYDHNLKTIQRIDALHVQEQIEIKQHQDCMDQFDAITQQSVDKAKENEKKVHQSESEVVPSVAQLSLHCFFLRVV